MKNTLIIFLISFLLVCCSKSADSYFEEGEKNFKLDKYEAAILSYSEAIRINPKYADAYRRRGHSKSRVGRHKEAIMDFELAIKNNPNDFRPLFRKAFSLYVLNQFDKAIIEINKLLRLNPEYTKAYVLRAAVNYNKMDYKNTIADFSKVTDLEPHNPIGYYIKANYKYKIKDYNGSFADYKKSIEISTGFESYLYYKKRYILNLMSQNENEVDLLNDFIRAEELYYPKSESNFSKYKTLSHDDYTLISANMIKIISLNPNNIDAFILFGYTSSKINEKNFSLNKYSSYFMKNQKNNEINLRKGNQKNKNYDFEGAEFLR